MDPPLWKLLEMSQPLISDVSAPSADYTKHDTDISETDKIPLWLAGRAPVYNLRRNDREESFSETDTSYEYKKQDTGHREMHPPEVILSKFELLVLQSFDAWGEWELILEAHIFPTYERYRHRDFMNQNEVMSGAIYLEIMHFGSPRTLV